VVALGLLAGVLLSIAGLFAIADRQLEGGKNHTVALATARDILEEMDAWGYEQIYQTFGLDGSASAYTVETTSNPYAAKWQPQLEDELGGCSASITIESAVESGTPPALRDARTIRIRVTVSWTEGPRARSVSLVTVRV
jgi:hypothetical protein